MAAKELSMSLIGEKTTTSGGGVIGGERKQEHEHVYNFKVSLDGEKEYDKTIEYPFEIKLPADILNVAGPQIGGVAGQALKFVTGAGSSTRWRLQAKLDIPRGIDVKKDVDVAIG